MMGDDGAEARSGDRSGTALMSSGGRVGAGS